MGVFTVILKATHIFILTGVYKLRDAGWGGGRFSATSIIWKAQVFIKSSYSSQKQHSDTSAKTNIVIQG
jgi:hypothetical protein